VIYQILTETSMNMVVMWSVALCSLVHIDRRFRCTYCLHHQGEGCHERPDNEGSKEFRNVG
jgi:hypothetical protein